MAKFCLDTLAISKWTSNGWYKQVHLLGEEYTNSWTWAIELGMLMIVKLIVARSYKIN